MAKKTSESSQPERLVRVNAESIFGRRLTPDEQSTLGSMAIQQAAGDDSDIDYSDIPELTPEQLARLRPPAKQLIGVRVDRDVLEWLKSFGTGYSTRVNGILRSVMESQQRS